MNISNVSSAPSYPTDAGTTAKAQPASATPPSAPVAPSAPVDNDGDHDGSLLNKTA